MKQEVITFRFKDLTMVQRARIDAEFNSLLEDIRAAMDKAGRKTSNPLQHAILRSIKDDVGEYIHLKYAGNEYTITLASGILRAFDVKLPINGIQVAAIHLARKIGSTFMWELNPAVRYTKRVMP